MKSTGIVRKLDELGRVVIPIELRNKFNISERDPIEMYVDGSNSVLKKYECNCIFCGNSNDLKDFKGKNICSNCLKKINTMTEKEKNKENKN